MLAMAMDSCDSKNNDDFHTLDTIKKLIKISIWKLKAYTLKLWH